MTTVRIVAHTVRITNQSARVALRGCALLINCPTLKQHGCADPIARDTYTLQLMVARSGSSAAR